MDATRHFTRPPFEDALSAWKTSLKRHGFPTEIIWILEENLCFERDPNSPEGIKLGFQIRFTPHPADAAKVTYHHFAEMDARLVFYRLGTSDGKSVCILLCDEWFENRDEKEGYTRRDNWHISFYPGPADNIEEITDIERWKTRVIRGRPLTAVDFCMTLAALHELKAHGRTLDPDERMGLKILRSMQQNPG